PVASDNAKTLRSLRGSRGTPYQNLRYTTDPQYCGAGRKNPEAGTFFAPDLPPQSASYQINYALPPPENNRSARNRSLPSAPPSCPRRKSRAPAVFDAPADKPDCLSL